MTRAAQSEPEALSRFLVGFKGVSLPASLHRWLAGGLAGVVLYPRNFESLHGLRALTEEIRAAAGRPVLIAVDQEGGPRFSLPEPFTQWPSAAELGEIDDAAAVERMANALGEELAAAGFNTNFAPMLDLHIQAESPVTTGRSFGGSPARVARLGAAFARGLACAGILACAKHFPGHGDTHVDPHHDLPVFQGSRERLRTTELVPFAAVIAAGVPMMMTAHISLPQIDSERPASLSPRVLGELLRAELNFRGAIVIDDLGMGAIAKRFGVREAAVEALAAGSDLILLCHDEERMVPAVSSAAAARAEGKFADSDWGASSRRIEGLRRAVGSAESNSPGLEIIGSAAHRALAAELRAHPRVRANQLKGHKQS